MDSINTNLSALRAAQKLNAVSSELSTTQQRISTGLKVATAKDNGATWAIANKQRATASALGAVTQSLARASSALDVAMTAGERVADILKEMKSLAVAAVEPSIDDNSRMSLLYDYEAHRKELIASIDSAEFDGVNLLKDSNAISFLSNADGSETVDVEGQDWNYSPWTPGPVIMLRGYSLDTVTYAGYALGEVDASIENVTASLGRLGSYARQVDFSIDFNARLQDAIEAGIGNLVDADLAKEGAKLQSLQVQQTLATQSLSIANAAPQWMLRLFGR